MSNLENTTDGLPYNEVEVRFQNDDITFAGTLTVPRITGPHPAVIMISGSGPNTQNSEAFGFKTFRIIADHLSRNGISVLRYDGRGVGNSTGKDGWSYTSEDFAGDTLSALKSLQKRSDIDPKKIGLIGHSEGGRIAPLVASLSKDVAFIILMAGFGMTGEENSYVGRRYWGKAEGETNEETKEAIDWLKRLIKTVRTGEGWKEIRADARKKALNDFEKLPEDKHKRFSNVNEYLNSTFEGMFLSMSPTPWFKFYLVYDPMPSLRNVTCPVLVMFGELDAIIPPNEHKDRILMAFAEGGNKDVTVKIIPKANHYFVTSKTGSWSEFRTIKKEFAPGFLNTMTNWILHRIRDARR
jgi:pimeloyl-ACP methyl ester carboxylesterase